MHIEMQHSHGADTNLLHLLQADKSILTAQLNLHTRDLRVLDPMLTQMNPCAILCRERAILINLEHVKCIVTTQYVLVLNVENRAVLSFLDELQKKLRQQVRPVPCSDTWIGHNICLDIGLYMVSCTAQGVYGHKYINPPSPARKAKEVLVYY